MAVSILYNDINIFSGQPIPFVGRAKENIYYGERWCAVERISLIGQLTGCDFNDLTTAQLNLISGFSQDFKKLQIKQGVLADRVIASGAGDSEFDGLYYQISPAKYQKVNAASTSIQSLGGSWVFFVDGGFLQFPYYSSTASAASPVGLTYVSTGVPFGIPPGPVVLSASPTGVDFTIDSFENIIVESITFPQSNYVKLLPYQIDLYCYPAFAFSGTYGIVDPVDNWKLNQTEDGKIEIEHEVSARGLDLPAQLFDSPSPLDRAANFVFSKLGLDKCPYPQFIQNFGGNTVLKKITEVIDRYNATYLATESYVNDQIFKDDYGILRYTVDIQKNQEGGNTATIQGTLEGSIYDDVSYPYDDFPFLRERIQNFDFYSSVLFAVNTGIKFNPIPLTKKITENQYAKKIDFNLSFDDNPRYQVNYDYNVSINSGIDLITVEVNGEINGRGDLADKWAKVQNAYALLRPYDIASQEFASYAGTGVKLDPNTTSESVSFDKFNGAISFSFSYQDKELPPNEDLLEFNYNINVTPPIRKIISTPLIYKTDNSPVKYEVTDIGMDYRGKLNIEGTAVPKRTVSGSNAVEATKTALRAKFLEFSQGYSNIQMESYSIGSDNQDKVSFSLEWSYNGQGVINGTNYSTIDFF